MIETSFVSPEEPKAWANKTGNDFMIFILIFEENCLYYDVIHDFSVWLRTCLIQRILIVIEYCHTACWNNSSEI